MATRLVECASCGAVIDSSEATADTELEPKQLLEQAPELVKFYCSDCWADEPGL